MKSALRTYLYIILSLFISLPTMAANTQKSYSFKYQMPKAKPFTITLTAHTQDEAFKLAARNCFKKLTDNKYPGEEKGLEIIDICANPKI